MAKAIFTVLFKVVKSLLNIVLFPVNALIVNLFPDFTTMISSFTNLLSTYVSPTITWFSSILPPTTRSLLLIYLYFLVTYYTVSYTVHLTIKLFKIIQRIKFW